MRPSAPILLVDDEPANLLAMEAVLESLGEPLVRASSGMEAMRVLRDQDFAAVLLDLHRPGMDGIETARLIRAQKRPALGDVTRGDRLDNYRRVGAVLAPLRLERHRESGDQRHDGHLRPRVEGRRLRQD